MTWVEGVLGRYFLSDARDRANWRRVEAFVRDQPQAFENDPRTGHVTGSAFVLDHAREKVLLTHHKKLDRWFQLGGHCDGEHDVAAVARREALEESGFSGIDLASPDIFDIDIHEIPTRKGEPAHLHYDLRYLFGAAPGAAPRISAESKALAWVALDRIEEFANDPSVTVVRRKLAAQASRSSVRSVR